MSYPSFTSAAATVDRFLTLLEDCGVELMGTGRAGGEALAMSDVIEMWRDPTRRPADPRPVVRAAMGFVDLAGKVLSVSAHPSFGSLIPHLQMLAKTTVLQNAHSPVTDDAGNKVIELYAACLAMTFAVDVALDHPQASKGDNPDVMLDFRGERWALALKTLHSRKPRTIYDNIKKAADQIEASAAAHGLVLLNVKNELDYDALWPSATLSLPEAVVQAELCRQMKSIAEGLAEIPPEDWMEALGPDRKAELPVVFLGQTASSAIPADDGRAYFMPLKNVMAHMVPQPDRFGSLKLVKELHHAAQQFT